MEPLNQAEIRQARIDLAAAFRWAVRQGLNEGICNHFSMDVGGGRFLVNAHGWHWAELTASRLLVADFDGRVLRATVPVKFLKKWIQSHYADDLLQCDDVGADSRLLMRRNVIERVSTLAPFLIFDSDPYLVLTSSGRLVWMLDGFTTASSFPYARSYRLNRQRLNYMRNSVKATVDAYDGDVQFYVFDDEDPIIAAYRHVFPTLLQSGDRMPDDLRAHVRYPELLLEMQALAYGLYHMTEPTVFYNREDLWSVATEVAGNAPRDQPTAMEPNFVLMRLPGESAIEFVEMLPFTPANRNNLIGWIAGRSDRPHYGSAIVYTFPKNRLIDGPLAPAPCASITQHRTCDWCDDEATCTLKSVWTGVRDAVAGVMDATSFGELVRRAEESAGKQGRYYI